MNKFLNKVLLRIKKKLNCNHNAYNTHFAEGFAQLIRELPKLRSQAVQYCFSRWAPLNFRHKQQEKNPLAPRVWVRSRDHNRTIMALGSFHWHLNPVCQSRYFKNKMKYLSQWEHVTKAFSSAYKIREPYWQTNTFAPSKGKSLSDPLIFTWLPSFLWLVLSWIWRKGD